MVAWGEGAPWGFGSPWGEGLTIHANPLLRRPSVVWLFELSRGWPMRFPLRFDQPPLRVSTTEVYGPEELGGVLFTDRVHAVSDLRESLPEAFGGGPSRIDGMSIVLRAFDRRDPVCPDLHAWLGEDPTGALLRGHLFDMRTGELDENVFVGHVEEPSGGFHLVTFACTAFDMASLTTEVPALTITTDWAPYAATDGRPSGGLGSKVAVGAGIARRIPAPCVRTRSEINTLVTRDFTVDDETDLLTIVGHELEHGQGPMRLRSTGTLPGGLSGTVDVWISNPDGDPDTFMVARSRANAVAVPPIVIDITDAGIGTHTLSGGQAPNLDDTTDLVPSVGNLGVARVFQGGVPEGSGYLSAGALVDTFQVLPRLYRPHGRRVTAIRLPEDLPAGTPVTVDGILLPDLDDRDVAEWDWLRGFDEKLSGFHARIGSSLSPTGITTAALIPGMGLERFALGAVRFNGIDDYLETAAFPAFGTFTAQFLVRLRNQPGNVLVGPSAADGDVPAWRLHWDATSGLLGSYRRIAPASEASVATPSDTLAQNTWLLLTVAQTPERVQVYRNTALLLDAPCDPIAYGTATRGILFGADIAGGGWFKGDLGWTRIGAAQRTVTHARRSWFTLRRNFASGVRRFFDEARQPVDAASWQTSEDRLDAIEDGGLRFDGYVTRATPLSDIARSAAPARDLMFGLTRKGRVSLDVPQAPTEIVAQIGTESVHNLMGEVRRLLVPRSQKVRRVVIQYRPGRDVAGAFREQWERKAERRAMSSGDVRVWQMPFVDDPLTADIIACWLAKRIVTRNEALDVPAGIEGRTLRRGSTARVYLPEMGITARDVDVITLAKGPTRTTFRGVTAAAADHVYDPGVLDADPAPPILRALDLPGAVLEVAKDGRTITMRLSLLETIDLYPIGVGDLAQFPVLVGAGTQHDALAVDDGDTAYIAGGIEQWQVFRFASLTKALPVRSVELFMRLATTAPAPSSCLPVFAVSGGALSSLGIVHTVSTGGAYGDYTATVTAGPGGRRLTIADLNGMQAGLLSGALGGGSPLRWTFFRVRVRLEHQVPELLGRVAWWMLGPSPTEPAFPLETDPPLHQDRPLSFVQQVDASGRYWIYARVYDALRRSVRAFGPMDVTVT